MDTYEKIQKKSPYADSPYECAWAAPALIKPQAAPTPRKKRKEKRGIRPWLAIVLLAVFCTGTAVGVSALWQGKMERMETAMYEKFAALEQLYSENQIQDSTQIPVQGPMNPGQVYAQNVKAVVAVNARFESAEEYSESIGSGFLISANGYVVTNCHVVGGANKVSVTTNEGKTLKAQVIGTDSTNDVAVLKVEGENFPFVVLGSSDKTMVGDQVAAIGNPLGELTATMTVGYISARDRVVDTDGSAMNMLQTDAAINSGNSGGPLFNMNGEVIGIITAKYSGNTESGASIEGLGFAIPIDDVAGIISDLKEYGYVTGAYLGVYVRDVDAAAQSYGLPAGAYVEEAISGYCAAEAGIRAGDIIISVGGYDVDTVNSLTRALRRFKAGDAISVTVFRSGKREYLTVTLDEKPSQATQSDTQIPTIPSAEDIMDWFGDILNPFS